MQIKIYETTDYDQFKLKNGNREVNNRTVERLSRSIRRKNMLSANPIIVNEDKEIIDGQHRLEVAKRLKIPIFYVIFNPASLPEIQMLNANVKPWSSMDFMESYITLGQEEYVRFKDFYERYQFPFKVSLDMMWRPSKLHVSSSSSREAFRNGTFRCPDVELSYKIAEEIEGLLLYAYPRVRRSTNFFKALFYMRHKHPDLLEKLKMKLVGRRQKLFPMASRPEYLRMFEDILNEGNYSKRIVLY